MIRFFKSLKRAVDFFYINPDGLSFKTEKRFRELERNIRELKRQVFTPQGDIHKPLEYFDNVTLEECENAIKDFKKQR
jgi:hypothetical protein